MAILSSTMAVNAAVAAARSLPDLVGRLSAIDPALAVQLQTKLIWQSKTPWGVLLIYALTWLSARYGLQLDPAATQLVAGAGVLLGSFVMRLVTRQPVSLFAAAPAPPAA